MKEKELIPHLFRTEYRKIVSVLCKLFGIAYIGAAEDIASDTFLAAAETWGVKGIPDNPVAWLYSVAKNKTRDYLKRHLTFRQKIAGEIKKASSAGQEESDRAAEDLEAAIDLSDQHIKDSQLQMMFAICHPAISMESQIGLALNILCGFGATEIAEAFLSNTETIYKRLARAKAKLRQEQILVEWPTLSQIRDRLEAVLRMIYLLFNEGYYSASQNGIMRRDLCAEAMRLALELVENDRTNDSSANALLSLMCFHASRFEARIGPHGESILYEDQDTALWDQELIGRGIHYLTRSSRGGGVSKYHLEAAIAYWHTHKTDSTEKWESILQLYNKLLQIEYSPIIALNRTYALARANGKKEAIIEAEKLDLLAEHHLYHMLLAELHNGTDDKKSMQHLQKALTLVKTGADKDLIEKKIRAMEGM